MVIYKKMFLWHNLKGFVDPEQPKHVCKLRKALYGLEQAPRAWFEKLQGALLAWGFQNSMSDTSLFHTCKHERLLLLLVYVDDILITGENKEDIQQVIQDLHAQFALKSMRCKEGTLGK